MTSILKLCAISLRQSCFEVQLLIANVICKVFFTFLRRYWFFTFAFRSYIVLFLLILTCEFWIFLVVILQFNHRLLKTLQPLQDNLLDQVEFKG